MRPRLPVALALALLAPALAAASREFPHPERIRYDGQCLTIEGKDVFVYSGSFHYFRCPKALWPDRFRRIKEAGCNAVETYVPWNLHEPKPPSNPDDYSQVDLSDLRDWLRMAHDRFGFYTILRPGPYICAEWDGGGFPRWLLAKRPASSSGRLWLRSAEPTFLAWSRHWLKAVCPVVADQQITRRRPGTGGVILFQIENEYDLYKQMPDSQRTPHLRALYEEAIAGGIDVPVFTCWTRQARDSADPELSRVFDAFNAYPRFKISDTAKNLAKLESEQPDAPAMISELQGGWFGKVGGALSEDQPGLTPAQLNAHVQLAIQGGATILNYYMIFGGTNFGFWGARDQTTSYDYDAPIREAGGVGEKYRVVAALGRMLATYGPELARSRPLASHCEPGSPDVEVGARRTRQGATFLFLHNRSQTAAHKGTAAVWFEHQGEIGVDYDLGPFASKMLRMPPGGGDPALAEWLPKPVSGPRRPAGLPAPVRPSVAEVAADPVPASDPGAALSRPDEIGRESDPVAAPAGVLLPELGVFDGRPVLYQTTLELDPGEVAGIRSLRLRPYKDDRLVVEINGRILSTDAAPPPPAGRNRPEAGGAGPEPGAGSGLALGDALHAGSNSLRVLYLQKGAVNFGPGIDDEAGLRSAELDGPDGRPLKAIAGWTLRRRISGMEEATGASADPGPLVARYRVEFDLPSPTPSVWVPWRARIDATGDGVIFLNGHSLGRYWEIGPQRQFYLPECWLRFGAGSKNVLAFTLVPTARGARVQAVEIAPYGDLAEMR